MCRDGGYAPRLLRKASAFTVTATLSLGVAIGINTAVYGLVDTVLLRPLPYPADRLALVSTTIRAAGVSREETAQHGLSEIVRDRATTFDRTGLAADAIASLIPALRVARLDPATTLRHE